jgi:hypothetical protein
MADFLPCLFCQIMVDAAMSSQDFAGFSDFEAF